VSRVFNLSGYVARDLSGRHSHQKEVANETDRSVIGDRSSETLKNMLDRLQGLNVRIFFVDLVEYREAGSWPT
jgi:hypothetical protein